MMGSQVVITVMLSALLFAAGEEQQQEKQTEAQGRQLNWNGVNFASNSNNGGDLEASASTAAKSSSNYPTYPAQSLDEVNYRDGSDSYGYGSVPESSYSRGSYAASSGYGDDKLGGFVSALSAFLPIGLFLAAIVPNVITIGSGRRKRSETEEARAVRDEATFPILDMISSFGVRALQEPQCQSKIVCEIGRMGGLPEANTVQRALWLTANYVPERLSRAVGLDKLFRQIRSQQCTDFACSSG